MNTFFRSTLLAALIVLPTAAFAQPVVQVDETQVEMIAYEVGGPDSAVSAASQGHFNAINGSAGAHAGMVAGGAFSPADDVGLNSVYLHH